MNSRRLNRLELLNEFGLVVLTNQLFLFTDLVNLAVTRFSVGWFHIVTFLLLLVINLSDFLINTVIYNIILQLKKWKNEWQSKKKDKEEKLEKEVDKSIEINLNNVTIAPDFEEKIEDDKQEVNLADLNKRPAFLEKRVVV
jgi:hypothetical protein